MSLPGRDKEYQVHKGGQQACSHLGQSTAANRSWGGALQEAQSNLPPSEQSQEVLREVTRTRTARVAASPRMLKQTNDRISAAE